MFGTYRFVLALLVVLAHLAIVPNIGRYAVYAFFILSGYLMTHIMHKTYSYSKQGLKAYLFNRFLRIYPSYWLSITMSLVLLCVWSENTLASFHSAIYFPDSFASFMSNFLIIFSSSDSSPRLSPPTWALTIELVFYAFIGLGLSKTRIRVWLWAFVSLAYHVIAQVFEWEIYSSIFAASLPFSLGALIFFYKSSIYQGLMRFNTYQLVAAILTLMFLSILNWGYSLNAGVGRSIGFYFSLFLNALIIMILAGLKSKRERFKIVDRSLGNYSYPFYLMHIQVGFLSMVTINLIGFEIEHSLTLFAVSLPLMIGFSQLFIRIEASIERTRKRLKQSLVKSDERNSNIVV